jgi:hypothetical protein
MLWGCVLNFANHPKNLVPNGKNRSYIVSSTGHSPQYVRAATVARTRFMLLIIIPILMLLLLPTYQSSTSSFFFIYLFIMNYFALTSPLIDDNESPPLHHEWTISRDISVQVW